MAVGDLSPWPASTAAASLTAARAAVREAVKGELSDGRVDRLGATASAMVEQYAAAAPQALKDEAVIRFVGYLAEAPAFRAVEKQTVGPLDIQYAANVNHGSAFRNCGAAMLLSRWRARRAGSIG